MNYSNFNEKIKNFDSHRDWIGIEILEINLYNAEKNQTALLREDFLISENNFGEIWKNSEILQIAVGYRVNNIKKFTVPSTCESVSVDLQFKIKGADYHKLWLNFSRRGFEVEKVLNELHQNNLHLVMH